MSIRKKYRPEMIEMLLGHPSFKTKNQTTAESCKGNKTNLVSIPQVNATLKSMPEPTIIHTVPKIINKTTVKAVVHHNRLPRQN